jgi:dTDP-glucose 4,6-dehydratase
MRTYGFPAVITRASNNYGPYQFPEKFIPLMVTNSLDDKPLPVYGDGAQERDWLHTEDHCRAIVTVLERGRMGEVYNIGGGHVEKNLDMVRRLLRIMGKPESLIRYVKDRPGHDRRYALDCCKITRELGWSPRIPLEDGLKQTVEWYKANGRWLGEIRKGEYRTYYEKYYVNRDSSLRAISNIAG